MSNDLTELPLLSDNRYPTSAWNISGISTEAKTFQRKLQHSCLIPGEVSLTTHSLGSGIASVLNGKLCGQFLSALYSKGYSYNSINSYRSAISSVHDKVDGVVVGQHPSIVSIMLQWQRKGVLRGLEPPLSHPQIFSTSVSTMTNSILTATRFNYSNQPSLQTPCRFPHHHFSSFYPGCCW